MKLWEVMQSGDATRTYDDHHSCGGGYTPLDVGGAGGRYTLAVEEVHQEDTPYMLGRSLAVGTSKVPFCACECLKCNENMNMLLSKIETLIEAQLVTKATINKLISERGIYPSSRISEPFTPIGVKRRRNQISRTLTSAKKKVVGTPKITANQPMERLSVNLYKYADDKKKKKIQQMIKLKRSTKNLYTIHEFNYQDFECMTNMDRCNFIELLQQMQQLLHLLQQLNEFAATDAIVVAYTLSEESLKPGAIQLKQSLDEHNFTDYFLDYYKGVRPYPGGVP
ncbi:hypothetical protein HAX54_047976 [Datura stramonium]|uniref:Uncharacterized protein n=1 Tax=Datura stramonium TaxID=4076 RepID=A0ABS8STP3_DATST|nr:hypothetical protein [Datura stramonium]